MFDQANSKKPYTHTTYFELVDSTPELKEKYIKACVKYLSGYDGQTHFSIGYRNLNAVRDVNATNFQIVVHMVFAAESFFTSYSNDPKHELFITEVAGMCLDRIVYDSFQDLIIATKN